MKFRITLIRNRFDDRIVTIALYHCWVSALLPSPAQRIERPGPTRSRGPRQRLESTNPILRATTYEYNDYKHRFIPREIDHGDGLNA